MADLTALSPLTTRDIGRYRQARRATREGRWRDARYLLVGLRREYGALPLLDYAQRQLNLRDPATRSAW